METWDKLSRMSEKQVRQLQEQQVQSFLGGEVASRHPAYREAWQAGGVPRSLADLAGMPFTVKDDLLSPPGKPEGYQRYVLEAPAAAGSGGGLLGKLLGKKTNDSSLEKYATSQVFFSAGRTGRITPFVYSAYDVEQLREAGLRLLDILGLSQDDTMVNAMPYLPNLCFWQIYYATVSMGATALQSGGGRILGLEKIITALENMEASTLFTTPGYAEFLLYSAIHHQVKLPSLQNIIVGYTPVPLPVVRRLEVLARMVGSPTASVKRIYFLNEAKAAWAECAPGSGYHFYPDHSLPEAAAPGAGLPGRPELVLTNLDVKGSCVVRFRTGDTIDGITYETCPSCKRGLPRLTGEVERLQDVKTIKVNGQEKVLNLNSLYGLLAAEPEVLLWQAVVSPSQGGLGLGVALRNKDDAPKVLPRLQEMLAAELGVAPQVAAASYREMAERLGLEKHPVEKRIIEGNL